MPRRSPPSRSCSKTPEARGHYVYVLRCSDGSLYTGYTVDVERRLAVHQAGKGARYTRARLPVSLCGFWDFGDRSAAMSAEACFKRLDRASKLALLASSQGEIQNPGEFEACPNPAKRPWGRSRKSWV